VSLVKFLVRLILVAGGLLLAASLAAVSILMLMFWGVRSAWAKLTGRSVMPFVIRIDPRGGFDRMYRAAGEGAGARRADSVSRRANLRDVMDVEPRLPKA
jgi:hypothetical protein